LLVFLISASSILVAAPPSGLPLAEPGDPGINESNLREISDLLQQLIDDGSVAGMVAGVARQGKVVYLESRGWQDIESQQSMQESSIFQIRSMSKPITAVAAMQLVEQGKMALSDPVSKYIPRFGYMFVLINPDEPFLSAERKPSREITIEDLLLNTSGLSHRNSPFYQQRRVRSRGDSLAQLSNKVAGVPLIGDPGAQFQYSISLTIVGRIIEIVSGQGFDAYLQENIFDPLDMADTGFYIPEEKTDRMARIYLAPAENQLLTDLVPSLRIVTGNSNAIFHTYHFQGPWATGPKGYYAIDLNTTATDNKYELAFNTHATPTGTGSEGGAYGQNNWGIHINAPLGTPLDASGVANPALKSIYEQLMNVPGRSQIMQTRDISGVVDNSNTTLAGGFPFIAGDKLVMYLRPKIVFAAQTSAEQTTSLIGFTSAPTLDAPVFNVGRSGQGITGQTYNQSDHYPPANADTYKGLKAFDGTVTGTYGWLANNPFNTTTGAYTGSVTTSVDGANILGSWVEVNVGKKVAVNNYKIYPQNHEIQTIGSRSPHIFKLVYSNDGTNFITADSQTVGTGIGDTSQWATSNDGSATYIPKTFTLTENTVGQYWRLLVTSVYGGLGGGGALGIQELELRGVDSFTEKGDVSGGAISDISGLITNVIATAADIQTAFPGNATTGPEAEALKWGWMGSANSDSLSLDTTDEQSVRTCDLHIWKITITL